MDLSFPPNHSVNDGIPSHSYLGEPFHLCLPGVDSLVTFIHQFGQGCVLFKTDLSHAYRQLPVDPRGYHFLGYEFDNLLFFDTTFAFGLRSTTLGCQRTTNAITYLYVSEGFFCTNYIDDFGGCDTPSRAPDAFHALKHLLCRLGLQSSPDKDCPPTTLMVFLGILINTVTMTLSVPQEKIADLLHKLQAVSHASIISRRQLQSVLGLISFVTACVCPGRIFMSALFNALRGLQHAGFAPVTPEICSDIRWWLHFLPRYNGVSLIPPPTYLPDVLFTDACATGAGGHFQHQCFHVAFPPVILDDNNNNINIKELLAIIVALRLWGPQLTGRHLLIRSDNNSAVLAINNHRSHSLLTQQCLRIIWFLCASFDLDIQAEHIPGFINEIADLLSRWYQDPQAEEKFYALPDADQFLFCDCSTNVFDLAQDL